MENKKLGKYFTKGLQAGVLATALIAGNVSCSNAAGGNSTEFDGNSGGQTGYTKPDYMNVDVTFGGQRFIEENGCFNKNPNKGANFNTYYTNAKAFMTNEVTSLKNLVASSNSGSTLSGQITTLLQNYNQSSSITDNIDQNYTALTPVFKAMRNSLTDDEDYNRFNISYWKLAADAYNQSLGEYANETTFTTNDELRNKSTNLFVQKLGAAGLDYAAANDSKQAETRMKNCLNTIAYETNTNVNVLTEIVKLALYNESLYGLNDHAVQGGVNNQNLNNDQRSLRTFNNKIADYSLYNMQSIDDRTM